MTILNRPLLLLIAGAKGAVGSTIAAAVAAMKKTPEYVLPSLTTHNRLTYLGSSHTVSMAGWDIEPSSLSSCIEKHGVLPPSILNPIRSDLDNTVMIKPAASQKNLDEQVEHLMQDIQYFQNHLGNTQPIFINLLPACAQMGLDRFENITRLLAETDPLAFPDIAYVLAAIRCGIPVVNFTPNHVECSAMVQEAVKHNVPVAGYDGKTGQTYFKVVLASAFKARKLYVDGWYSLNILGNADGKNLMDPKKAVGKVANKTDLLDDILGYGVGQRYSEPSHKVHIDYYPPRGDAKEAWDLIDFQGMFNLPMSIRLNFQGRDSVLAAPLILDLARWMAALKMTDRSGLVPELAFFFKKPLGKDPPLTFQDQVDSLRNLEKECDEILLNPK